MIDFVTMASLHVPKPTPWKGQSFRRVEVKYDGVNVTIGVCGDVRAIGRKSYINLWPLMERSEVIRDAVRSLPTNTAVNGELWVPGGRSADVKTALNAGKGFVFTAHATPIWEGEVQRNQDFQFLHTRLRNHGFEVPSTIGWVRNANWQYDAQQLLTMAEGLSYEGWVLKQESLLGWYKIKTLETADVVVMAANPGEGTMRGMVGSYTVGVYRDSVLTYCGTVGSGWDMDIRRTLEPNIGRVMEVKFQSFLGRGMQHSRFVQWRDDKPAEECRWEQFQ